MKRLSMPVLVAQAVLLVPLTLLGLLLAIGALLPGDLAGSVAGATLLFSLVSGWRLLVWVVRQGPSRGHSVSGLWLGGAGVGVLATALAWAQELGVVAGLPHATGLFLPGIYFLPTLLHMAVEQWLQLRPNNSSKPTPLRGAA